MPVDVIVDVMHTSLLNARARLGSIYVGHESSYQRSF